MKIVNLCLFFFPSFFHIKIRRILGSNIGKNVKIKFGTYISSDRLEIGNNVIIGPFAIINSKELFVDDNSTLKPLSLISALKIKIGKYAHISPLSVISGDHTINSFFYLGDHSRVFPFCWIETGEGVEIGNNVGVGGHTLIFTHGVWPNYLDGGPISYGPVRIKDNVWLPWRVFIMPNVEIGANSIIGANSLVNKSIPENVIAAGSPAKIVNNTAIVQLSENEIYDRLNIIMTKFSVQIKHSMNIDSVLDAKCLSLANIKISVDNYEDLKIGDLVLFINKSPDELVKVELANKGISYLDHKEKKIVLKSKNIIFDEFISFLRRYGVRLYIELNY